MQTKTPKDVLSLNTMVDVLTDIHKADAYINLKVVGDYQKYQKLQKKNAFYNSIYLKFNITQAKLDQSLSFYIQNPDLFKLIYQKVISKIGAEIEIEKKRK